MGKAVVFLIVFLVLIGVLAFAYFKYEKPIKDTDSKIYYTNLTIFADNLGDELI